MTHVIYDDILTWIGCRVKFHRRSKETRALYAKTEQATFLITTFRRRPKAISICAHKLKFCRDIDVMHKTQKEAREFCEMFQTELMKYEPGGEYCE